MKQHTTTKKVKYVGTQQFINAETGEIENMQVTSIEDRDFNFTKVWMKNFINTLDIVGNQKTRFCFWCIDHLNKDNMLIGTQRQLAEESGVSLQTVNLTLKILMDVDFLRKQSSAVYIVNPDILFKGTINARLNILRQYQNAERIALSDQEKLENIMDSISKLQRQAEGLKRKIADKNQLPGQQEIIDEDMHMREVV